MITIKFAQCGNDFKQDDVSIRATLMPILTRIKFYEEILEKGNGEFCTLDEHMILIAQYLKRNNKINVKFVEVCWCDGIKKEKECIIDKDGDFVENNRHGLFNTRLKYLR